MTVTNNLRYDFQIIESWIKPGSKVLGLGCGDGSLLYSLKKKKQISETGIEIRESNVAGCIEKGLTVIQGDINTEVHDYPDAFFDTVVLSQTLQETYEPVKLLKEILRIGKTAVVSFPNFSHWKTRVQFLFRGAAPVTEQLPYTWYDTPNIRVLSINDFKSLSQKAGFRIVREVAIKSNGNGSHGKTVRFLPNVRATYGIFLIKQQETSACPPTVPPGP